MTIEDLAILMDRTSMENKKKLDKVININTAPRPVLECIEALEAEAEERHQAELDAAVARHPGEEEVAPGPVGGSLDEARALAAERPAQRAAPKIGRNDPCPCGSGKKFKQCHGSVLEDANA